MIYSYNRLWKILIDRKITKAQIGSKRALLVRMCLPKWARMSLFLWKTLQKYVPRLNVALTILWK